MPTLTTYAYSLGVAPTACVRPSLPVRRSLSDSGVVDVDVGVVDARALVGPVVLVVVGLVGAGGQVVGHRGLVPRGAGEQAAAVDRVGVGQHAAADQRGLLGLEAGVLVGLGELGIEAVDVDAQRVGRLELDVEHRALALHRHLQQRRVDVVGEGRAVEARVLRLLGGERRGVGAFCAAIAGSLPGWRPARGRRCPGTTPCCSRGTPGRRGGRGGSRRTPGRSRRSVFASFFQPTRPLTCGSVLRVDVL